MELRSKPIGYSKEERCKLRNKEEVLEKELQELDSKICNKEKRQLNISIISKKQITRKN